MSAATMASTSYETIRISVCTDCAMLVANGETPEDLTESEAEAFVALIEDQWPTEEGWHLSIEDGETHFSKSQCDGCGSSLGGDRFPAVAMREERDESRPIRLQDLRPSPFKMGWCSTDQHTDCPLVCYSPDAKDPLDRVKRCKCDCHDLHEEAPNQRRARAMLYPDA